MSNDRHHIDETEFENRGNRIAIIGMAGRFPQSSDIGELWENLCQGRECISRFSDEQLRNAGVSETQINLPGYVKAGGVLPDYDRFDAAFFGIRPAEAEVLDPQHRLLLELAWQALENAACDPYSYKGSVGLFAGCGTPTYLMFNLAPNFESLSQRMDSQQIKHANDKDFMPLRVAYKLDLRGPVVNVQTACSTSLVAVHMACQSLINGECDVALAGGLSCILPMNTGYMYREGNILSPDGHCRAFDADAGGTVAASGGGVVVLKLLDTARVDGDNILAVIRGSAINNDGREKVSFTAPSVEGQAAVIAEALAVAGLEAHQIGLVEAHGTGTVLGDPIEVAALTRAFQKTTDKKGFCALTSTKSNIGHLDTGAGVTGLIKAILCIQKGMIPASINYRTANTKIDLANSPFYVNTSLKEWVSDGPRRAGVSSFGVGGTNAHVVLEQAPEAETPMPGPDWLLLPVSAKTPSALERRIADLCEFIKQGPHLGNLSFTLQVGRAGFNHRAVAIIRDEQEAGRLEPGQFLRREMTTENPPVVFMFSGQGAQKVGMARDIFLTEPGFEDLLYECAEILQELGLGQGIAILDAEGREVERLTEAVNIMEIIYPEADPERAELLMRQTAIAQPVLYSVEYAMAQLWLFWGVHPEAMVGHSVGEYVAATLAGVLTLENALALIEYRGRLMQSLPAGAMLAVALNEQQAREVLGDELSLAAINGPEQSVISGPLEAINGLQERLQEQRVVCRRLATSHAFHSSMLDPILDQFVDFVADLELAEPKIPYVSNLTGQWIEPEQATDPQYYADHLRQAVRFNDALNLLFEEPGHVFLEIGPGQTLAALARRHPNRGENRTIVASMPRSREEQDDRRLLLDTMASLWMSGVVLDWANAHEGFRHSRLVLPDYPFEKQRFWIASPLEGAASHQVEAAAVDPEVLAPVTYARPGIAVAYVEPRNEDERKTAAVWGELLGIAKVGANDSFLELGGDSILMTRVGARLRAVFNLDFALSDLFEHATVAEQAELAARLRQEGRSAEHGDIKPASRSGFLPLSFAQQRLWALTQIDGPNPAYNMPLPFRLLGKLDMAAIQKALSLLVERHESLRTTFPEVDGRAMVFIKPPAEVELPVTSLAHLSGQEREDRLTELLEAAYSEPFDLAAGPLFRVSMFRLDEEDHVLLMIKHHIISDLWSVAVLISELASLYKALSSGESAEQAKAHLAKLPIQYADFASWQRQMLSGEELDRQLNYWKKKLEGAPGFIDLPTDRPYPPVQSFEGSRIRFRFGSELTQQLKDLARAGDATLFMCLQALFLELLHRYTGQEDILLGSPIANRTRAELEGLIGFFVNTLVLRGDLSGDPSFSELLVRARNADFEAYSHQDVPFEQVVDALKPERDVSRNPVFQVMFALQNAPVEAIHLPELTLGPLSARSHSVKFEIGLDAYDQPDGIFWHMEYNTSIFDQETMERMAAHLQILAEAVVARPQTPLSQIELLTAKERNQALYDWNATETRFAGSGLLHTGFFDTAQRQPNRIALTTAHPEVEDQHLTYAELASRSNSLAALLQSLGAGPETLVALFVERSPEMSVGLYGILAAGAAYLPLDVAYPSQRLSYLLEDSGARLVLTQKHLRDRLPQGGPQVICLDEPWPQAGQASEVNLSPASAAYLIYTSGSTGKPKGVLVNHGAIFNRLEWGQATYPFDEKDRILQKTPYSFDVSVIELFWPQRIGACLVMAEPDLHGDPEYLLKTVTSHQISSIHFVPGMLRAFLDAVDISACTSLKKIYCSGEALPPELRDRLLARLKLDLINLYGPTEAAVEVSHHLCRAESRGLPLPIGRPVANTGLYVLDRRMEPVPCGVAGALYLGGQQLARGYFGRPGLTAAAFVPHPFGPRGERLYRTGDLARFLPDGNVMYLGRLDHQVKVRGFRIELGEIDAALNEHARIREAICLAPSLGGEHRLVAYIVPMGEDADANELGDGSRVPAMTDASELRSFLAERLPKHMIPSIFVKLKRLPLSPSGKTDRNRLGRLQPVLDTSPQTFVGPRTPTEQTLAEIWARTLRLEKVGIYDNFFEMGGDSILGIQIVSRARHAGLSFTARQLFEHQTIAGLAPMIARAVEINARQEEISGPVTLTPVMHWFFNLPKKKPHHFNQSLLLQTPGHIKAANLEQAIELLIRHHDALRMRFSLENGQWSAKIQPYSPSGAFSIEDLSAVPTAERKQRIESICAAAQASLNLQKGPLLRAIYFQVGEEARLLLAIHHLVVDGVSWRVLLEDLQMLYRQLEEGEPILPAKTSAFQDWAERMAAYASSEELAEQASYWQREIELGRIESGMKPDMPGADQALDLVGGASRVSVGLDQDYTSALVGPIHSAYHTRIEDFLLTALLLAWHKVWGDRTLVVDLEGHGREDLFADLDVTRTVGWFTTIYPVRLMLGASGDLSDHLKTVKEQLRLVPDRGIGFGLLRYLSNDRELADAMATRQPTSILFNYLGQLDQGVSDSPLFSSAPEFTGPVYAPEDPRSHAIEANGSVAGGRITMGFAWCPALFSRETIEALSEGWKQALMDLIDHCRQDGVGGYTPSDFPLARIGRRNFDRLFGESRDLADLYPLSPLQSGMLFHAMMDPSSYLQQFHMSLEGNLDLAGFQRAWARVSSRHPALRTAFFSDGLEQPLQAVFDRIEIPWDVRDWRDLSPAQQAENFQVYLEAERQKGFRVDSLPLLRCGLFRMKDQEWRFTLNNHHLLLDGWSLPIVLREVFGFYLAEAMGQTAAFPPAPAYRNYISWMVARDTGAELNFWKAELEGFSDPTPLPLEIPASAATPIVVREKVALMTGEQTLTLENFARRHHLTLNSLTQGAWALLLSRYSQSRDVLFGATVSGRPPEIDQVENMVGMLINTLPVRVVLDEQEDLVGWLSGLQEKQITRDSYAATPLVSLQQLTQVPRGQELFQTLVLFENYPVSSSVGDGGNAVESPLSIGDFDFVERPTFPLTLSVSPSSRIHLRFTWHANRIEENAMDRIIQHFQAILAAMAQAPARNLCDIQMLDETERNRVLLDWNQTAADYPREAMLHQLFWDQAQRHGDQIALQTTSGQKLIDTSYAELARRASRLANHLRSLGIGPDQPVGICTSRSLPMMVGLLGILGADGAYVPMDPSFPADRLEWMVEDSGLEVLVTTAETRASLPPHRARVVELDAEGNLSGLPELPSDSRPQPAAAASSSQLAYIIYTSGSTGKPKGVQLAHQSLVNFLLTMGRRPGLDAADRLLAITTISFDIAGLELYLPLINGARVLLATRETAADPDLLMKYLESSGATMMQATPATWRMLVDAGWQGHPGLKALCGGEALPPNLAAALIKRCASLWNMYGPTETTIWSTCRQVTPADCQVANLPIGGPIANTQVYLVDGKMNPQPCGVPGQLLIGGEGLARGYANRPAMTAEKFIPDPYAAQPGSRLYHTGDQARYPACSLEPGRLEFLGRMDHQVKVRGFRIELGEVEKALEAMDLVSAAVVSALPDASGQQRLVAYVIGTAGEGSLRTTLAETLPAYMIPSLFVFLEKFPLTPNGKINRRALPQSEQGVQAIAEYTAPFTATEQLVASVWADVLGLDRVGTRDHFFQLGGHSIMATRATARIRSMLERDLPLTLIFEHPVLADFAMALTALDSRKEQNLEPLPRAGEGPWSFPLSRAQNQLWLFHQIHPDTRPYHMPFAMSVTGSLALEALEKAANALVDRHESLRTTFAESSGVGVQVIHPKAPLELVVTDLSGLAAPSRDLLAAQLRNNHAQKPFDLVRGPLFRISLLRLTAVEHVLLINMHHIISDGWSIGVLVADLTALYHAFASHSRPAIPPLRIQYADYSAWQNRALGPAIFQGHLDWWKQQLAGAPQVQNLPLARPRPQNPTRPGERFTAISSKELAKAARNLCRQEGVTSFMLMSAVYQTLIHCHTGDEDIIFGTDVANRDRQEAESLIGFFVNQIVLRFRLNGKASFAELLSQTRRRILDSYVHQEIPFDQVVSAVNPERAIGINPLFQMKLVYQNAPQTETRLADLRLAQLPGAWDVAKFELLFNIEERGDVLLAVIDYDGEVYNRATITRLWKHFERILERAILEPETPLSAFKPMLEEGDRVESEKLRAGLESSRKGLLAKVKPRRR